MVKNHPAGKGVPSRGVPNPTLYTTAPAGYQFHAPAGPFAQAPTPAPTVMSGPVTPCVDRGVVIVTGTPFTPKEIGSQQSPNVGTIPCKNWHEAPVFQLVKVQQKVTNSPAWKGPLAGEPIDVEVTVMDVFTAHALKSASISTHKLKLPTSPLQSDTAIKYVVLGLIGISDKVAVPDAD